MTITGRPCGAPREERPARTTALLWISNASTARNRATINNLTRPAALAMAIRYLDRDPITLLER